MKTAIRFDQGTLRKPEMTPQGFLKVEGLVARAGILEYRNDDGSIRRELRLPEDVFAPASLAGYEGASLTDGHPTVLVDADNVRTLEDGTATAARRDGDWVAVPMVLKSKKLIRKVRSGKTGLSAGYTIRLDETPGVHPVYGRYDAIQRNITINHIACAVDVPRAGDGARIRLDGVGDVSVAYRADFGGKLTSVVAGHQHLLDPSGSMYGSCGDGSSGSTSWAVSEGEDHGHEHAWVRNADGTIMIAMAEGHTHTILDENRYSTQRTDSQIDRSAQSGEGGHMDKDEQIRLLTTQIGEANARASKAEADLKTRTDERDAATGKLAIAEQTAKEAQTRLDSGIAAAETEKVKEVQTRLDAATTEIADLKASIPELVRKRAALVTRAQAFLGNDYRADALDDRTILEAANRRIDPKADLSKMSVVELQARFDAFYDARATSAASTARIGAALKVRADEQPQAEPDPFDPLHNGAGQWASPHAAKKGA